MWCPSVSLSLWANAWLAGHAAPDDVLDALSCWAPRHLVTAYDSVAAGRTGLPWPDIDDVGPVSLLQTVRSAAGRRSVDVPECLSIGLVLPVPGDARGLTPGTQFSTDAMAAGEAMIIRGPDGQSIGVVPMFECEEADDDTGEPELLRLSWSVYSLPGTPVLDHPDLGESEYALRSAVRAAADALDGLRFADCEEDPRALVEELVQADRHHRVPDHAPERALRVLSTAAHVDAILTVTDSVSIGTQSSSQVRLTDALTRPLAAVVRTARSAAVSAILQTAWQR